MADNPLMTYLARLTPEQRREQASRAGKASAASKARYRHFQDLARELLMLEPSDPEVREKLVQMGVEPTNSNAILLGQIIGAIQGGTDPARFVRDTAGDKPTETLQAQINRPPVAARDLSEATEEELLSMVDSTKDG